MGQAIRDILCVVKTSSALRSYWSNQATGIVAEEVAELQLTPGNWGKISFE